MAGAVYDVSMVMSPFLGGVIVSLKHFMCSRLLKLQVVDLDRVLQRFQLNEMCLLVSFPRDFVKNQTYLVSRLARF